ncbi:YfiT family bacillithiol transferase [Rufibacter sp. LB8]|uniref:YfiT family bacillithiol transferase n=1 Tax=Rufibacter sp. LB8 TaxID=2777781 RepID=UPI00178C389D|nr:bacillithiol transferase BstA [Rufibacter sp. LB8]
METPTLSIEQLRFPLGRYKLPAVFQSVLIKESLTALTQLPGLLRDATAGLTQEQLDTPYRPGGWTVQQVVHHLADSHMNAYIRFKLALTEERPTIKPYDEAAWAHLADSKEALPEVSLQLLDSLHQRWVLLLQSLGFNEWHRTFVHPEGGEMFLFQTAGQYAWHGQHHLAHITSLRERMGW